MLDKIRILIIACANITNRANDMFFFCARAKARTEENLALSERKNISQISWITAKYLSKN